MTLVNSPSRHLRPGGLDEPTLTTNGSQFEKHSHDLVAAGIRRSNVLRDTVDARKSTGRKLKGRDVVVAAAIGAGRSAAI